MKKNIGKFWQTPDGSRRRIYLDEEASWSAVGWSFSFYNTGNVCSATVDDEHVSNSEAKNLIHGLREAKIYYDLVDRKFHWKQSYNRDFDRDTVLTLIAAMRQEIFAMAVSLNRESGGDAIINVCN